MNARYWLVSDGTVMHDGQVVPKDHGYQVILWDGMVDLLLPAGITTELEKTAKIAGRMFWEPQPKNTRAAKKG